MLIYRNSGDGVLCGNRALHGKDEFVYHADAAAVKSCFLGDGVCNWLVSLGLHPEDGEELVLECGFALHVTDRGWICDGGHEHVTAEVRYNEGWDYASDEDEAAQLRKHGVDAVSMSGGSI